jgi:hypothetical protein
MLFLYLNFFHQDDEAIEIVTHEGVPHASEIIPPTLNDQIKPSRTQGLQTKIYMKSIGFDPVRFDRLLAQKKLIKDFKNQIKLEIKLPQNMIFTPMDMEDEIAGIYGSSLSGDKDFVIMATPKAVNVSQVVEYLNDSRNAFPLLQNHKLLPDKIIEIPAPQSSGLNNLKIIPSSSYKGQSAYAALALRKDGKGTYLFLLEAPSMYFDQNEDGLELMLESIKSRP